MALSKQKNFVKKYCVTKLEYEESGRAICHQKFDEGISWRKMEILAWLYHIYLNIFESRKLESLVFIGPVKEIMCSDLKQICWNIKNLKSSMDITRENKI